ncbi:MAG TPA: hypothetical protein VK458_30435, partial [Myxococcaceae bacterium]|nr:hypothetical protein [Myxococcaceae bacterium]
MKFTLRNLGRLREATIDLDKDLILLTGPNNTSKTYVAHALYGLGEESFEISAHAVGRALEAFVPDRQEAKESLKIDVVEFFELYLPQMLDDYARVFRGELADVLASSEEFVAQAEVKLELGEEQLVWLRQALVNREDDNTIQQLGLTVKKAAGERVWTFERLPSASAAMDASGSSPPRRSGSKLFAYA